MSELRVFDTEAPNTSAGCPFRHDGYQLMRNQGLRPNAMLDRYFGQPRRAT